MQIRADYTLREVIGPEDYVWTHSPMAGVERVMLDRMGGEMARATSLVRYAPHSCFSGHTHGGGEEFLVLEGLFLDEHGEYPKGTYVRNPIGSKHTPRSGNEGALLLVKLYQFDTRDTEGKVINTTDEAWLPGLVSGLSVLPLHQFGMESVALVKWESNTCFQPHFHRGGEEIFVLSGTLYDERGEYRAGSWIRSPHMSHHKPFTREEGALIWVKTGHFFNQVLGPSEQKLRIAERT